jgi:hypothetical protein
MSENQLTLYFEGDSAVELVQTQFRRSVDTSLYICRRGKVASELTATGCFQWTSAVKALALLFVTLGLPEQSCPQRAARCISGHKGSLAASLDYALSKQPKWLQEMFGMGSYGTAYARRIILRTNAERKRPGPVTLGLNTVVLKPTNVEIFWNRERITCPDNLRVLLSRLGQEPQTALTDLTEAVGEVLAA